MAAKRSNLIPGETLIYERVDGVVYARYRDPPHNELPRWIIGGDEDAINKKNGSLFSWSEYQEMMELCKTNPTLKSHMEKLLDIYYIVRKNK